MRSDRDLDGVAGREAAGDFAGAAESGAAASAEISTTNGSKRGTERRRNIVKSVTPEKKQLILKPPDNKMRRAEIREEKCCPHRPCAQFFNGRWVLALSS